MKIPFLPSLSLVLLLALLGSSCSSPAKKPEIRDPHSFAIPSEAAVIHADLDLDLDFVDHVILGRAILEIKKIPGAQRLLLDTKMLDIEEVSLSSDTFHIIPATWKLGPVDSVLGQALEVQLKPDTRFVYISYRTHPDAEALQWLSPELTAGKRAPYLLTQSQAINARSWIPIQDGPGMRFTYEARVSVPAGLMAVMSAQNPTVPTEDGVYTFKMDQPIPAYLLALAVGDFAFRSVGPRTGIYAEPEVLEAASWEFAEMEELLNIAENLYGPYRWERYDLIVLPPSFPFGGMENPRITFATPTVIAGDRSLVALVAHEMAHSWSGNLVTNATWNDFWLNEGFTTYFENRIMEAHKGRDYSEMLAEISREDLLDEVVEFGPDNPLTRLKLDLSAQNPDDGMNSIAYDKGYYFLRLIEETTGRENFDKFLRDYFDAHAFETMTTEGFVEWLDKKLLSQNEAWSDSIRVEEWVYGTGIPDNIPVANSILYRAVEETVMQWMAGEQPEKLETENWSSLEWLHFLHSLPDSISTGQMAELDSAFGFTRSGNAEVLSKWFVLSAQKGYVPAYSAMRTFLMRVGRRKFLAPIYRALMSSGAGAVLARDIYAKARGHYHPIAIRSIDVIVH